MSFVGKETPEEADLRRREDDFLVLILKELTLLNARFEEAFETKITLEDVKNED